MTYTPHPTSRFGAFAGLAICSVLCCTLCSSFDGVTPSLTACAVLSLLSIAVFAPGIYINKPSQIGRLTAFIYASGLMIVSCSLLTRFGLFIGTISDIDLRLFGFTAALIFFCIKTARQGLGAVLRTASVLFIICAAIDLAGYVMLSLRVRIDNYAEIQPKGSVFAQISCHALPLCILPAYYIAGRSGKGFREGMNKTLLICAVVSGIFNTVLSLLAQGVLGKYAELSRFPFFTAAQSVGYGVFQRMDVVFLCARVIGIFVTLSILLCGVRAAAFAVSDKLIPRITDISIAVLVGGATLLSLENRHVRAFVMSPAVTAAVTVLLVFVLPVLSIPVFKTERVKRTAAVCLAVCISAVTFAGCDNVQLQDRMIVKSAGIDISGGECLLTVQYIDNYSDGDKQENRVLSVSGDSVSEAVRALKNSSGREPFFGQLSALIIGKNAFEGDIGSFTDYFIQGGEVRPTVRLYVSETTAYDILSFTQNGEIVPIDHLTGITPSSDPHDVHFTLLEFIDQTSPYAVTLKIDAGAVRLGTIIHKTPENIYRLDEDGYLTYCILNGINSRQIITSEGVSCEITDVSGKYKKVKDTTDQSTIMAAYRIKLKVTENPDKKAASEISDIFDRYLTELLAQNSHTESGTSMWIISTRTYL